MPPPKPRTVDKDGREKKNILNEMKELHINDNDEEDET